MAKLTILKRDGSTTDYTTYSSARTASVPGDLIQIWVNLDEQIELKSGVAVWIAPGVTLNQTAAAPTVINDTTNEDIPIIHRIYGYGKIKNSYETGSTRYECILITNPNTQLIIECDSIEGIGGGLTFPSVINAPSINIVNGQKFYLDCRSVQNERTCCLLIGKRPNFAENYIGDVNLNIEKIIIGAPNNTADEAIALAILGSGFIRVDEISCQHFGHCFMHSGGSLTSTIRKMTSVCNHAFGGGVVIVNHGQPTPNQDLKLYFDEVKPIKTSLIATCPGIQIEQGSALIIGRKVSSTDGYGIYIKGTNNNGDNISGYVSCSQIISEFSWGLGLSRFINQIRINSNYIEGHESYGGVYAQGKSNFVLKNCKVVNNSSTDSRCIVIEKFMGHVPEMTVQMIKAVTDNLTSGVIIFRAGFSDSLNVFNFSFFANKSLSGIDLIVGNTSNFYFIESPDLTN